MGRSVLGVLCVCLLAGTALGRLGSSWPAPLTAWGPAGLLSSKANLETLPAAQVLQELVGLAAGEAPGPALARLVSPDITQEQRPEAVVVFVSSQPNCAAAAAQLQTLSSAAGSWLQLPNAVHQGQSSPVFKGLQPLAPRLSLQVLGSCSGAPAVIPATLEALRQRLAPPSAGAAATGPTVVVVCADGSQDEGPLLTEAAAAAARLSPRHLFVHAAVLQAGTQAEQRRRLMQAQVSESAKYTVCDAKCKIQVKYLEGIIVFITILLAVCVGSCCMHAINTPTRFEVPKDARSSGHHD